MQALACDAAQLKLSLDPKDTLSKDLLAQVPAQGTGFGTCNLGGTCPSGCSASGVCLPAHSYPPSVAYNPSDNPSTCHCNGGKFGASCSATSDPLCADPHNTVSIKLMDSYGE